MAICQLEELKEYCGTVLTAQDSLLEAMLDAAETEVTHFCQRSSQWTGFEASTGTRYYQGDSLIDLPFGSQYTIPGRSSAAGYSHRALWLGDADLLSVDALTNGDGVAINSTSYWLEPRNASPYRYIRLRSDASWSFDTDGEIAVAGSWGYSTGPDPTIKECVLETARFLLNVKDSQVFDVVASPDIGILTVPKGMPAHVKLVLSAGGYRRTRPVT